LRHRIKDIYDRKELVLLFGLFSKKISAMEKHYEILNLLRGEKDEQKIIMLCEEDFTLVEDFKREYVKKAKAEADQMNMSLSEKKRYTSLPPSYGSYETLILLYERKKDFESAIKVCEMAIKAGFPYDPAYGNMQNRIERLEKRLERCRDKKSST